MHYYLIIVQDCEPLTLHTILWRPYHWHLARLLCPSFSITTSQRIPSSSIATCIPPCYYYIINYTGATGSISSNESMAAASMIITSFVTGGKEFDACLLLTSTSASAETTHNLNLYLLMVVNLLALDLYLEWDLPLELNLEMAIKETA